ncbi:MAG: hypothetical protein ACQEP9_07765 [Bacillota bacterium]
MDRQINLIISIISLFFAFISLIYSIIKTSINKKQLEVNRNKFEEYKTRYVLKNKVIFSVSWETDKKCLEQNHY